MSERSTARSPHSLPICPLCRSYSPFNCPFTIPSSLTPCADPIRVFLETRIAYIPPPLFRPPIPNPPPRDPLFIMFTSTMVLIVIIIIDRLAISYFLLFPILAVGVELYRRLRSPVSRSPIVRPSTPRFLPLSSRMEILCDIEQ